MKHQSVTTEQADCQKYSPPSAQAASSRGGADHPFLEFQRTIGNQAVSRIIQAKLRINEPGDAFEQEADRVADQVMRMPEPQVSRLTYAPVEIQRECSACASGAGVCPECAEQDEELHRKQDTAGSVAALTPASVAPTGGGESLGPSVRSFFETRFGRDFSNVRIHTDSQATERARSVNALAYTIGRDVVFGMGKYAPDNIAGRRLLAHELTHVIQQSPGTARSRPDSAADAANAVHVAGRTPGGGVVQRDLDCDIEHITRECNGAAASCMSVQKPYCDKKYPVAKEIDQLHKNAVAGAEAEKADIPNAADNLLHFLGASGTEKVMPIALFKNHTATKDRLVDEHRAKFIEGATKRLADGRLTPGGSAAMVWTGTAQAFNFKKEDLGLAVGGYTVCSKVNVSAADKGSGNVELTFDTWTVQCFDCYNWDPGKGIGNLFGDVSDKDLCCLQNAGKGKHFRIRTDPWSNDYGPSIAKEIMSASKPPPPSGGSKKDDDRR